MFLSKGTLVTSKTNAWKVVILYQIFEYSYVIVCCSTDYMMADSLCAIAMCFGVVSYCTVSSLLQRISEIEVGLASHEFIVVDKAGFSLTKRKRA